MTRVECICVPDYSTPDAPSLDVDDDCPRHREGGPDGNPAGTAAAVLQARIDAVLALHYRESWGDCAVCVEPNVPWAECREWPCPTVLALGGGPNAF